MKYILMNDFKFLIKNKRLLIASYLSIILLFLFTIKTLRFDINRNTLCKVIGISYDFKDNYMYLFIYVLNVCISIYLCIILFSKDIKIGKENIFLRLKKEKWFLYKMISIFFTITLLKTIIYVFTFLILNNGTINFQIIFLDLMNIYCVQIASIIVYYIGLQYRELLFLLFLIIIVVFYKINNFNLLFVDNCNLLISMAFIFLFMISIFLFKNNYILFFEKEEN